MTSSSRRGRSTAHFVVVVVVFVFIVVVAVIFDILFIVAIVIIKVDALPFCVQSHEQII